jgi:hypothetical protein
MTDTAKALEYAQGEHEAACRMIRSHIEAGDDPHRVLRVELEYGWDPITVGVPMSELTIFSDYLESYELEWDAEHEGCRILTKTSLRVLSDLFTVLRPVICVDGCPAFLEMVTLDQWGCSRAVLERLSEAHIPPTLEAALMDLTNDYEDPCQKLDILCKTMHPHSSAGDALSNAHARLQESRFWLVTALVAQQRSVPGAFPQPDEESPDPDLRS